MVESAASGGVGGTTAEGLAPASAKSSAAATAGAAAHATTTSGAAMNNGGVDEGLKSQARSERKRSREKQRRTDVNKQFGELTEVLKRIEAEEQQLQQERAAR